MRHLSYPEDRLDEDFFPHRIRIVLPFLDFEWKISWIPAGKLCHSCRKCSCVSRLRFIVNFFVKIVQISFVLLFFDWFSLIFRWTFLGRVCKTALYVPEDLFEAKRLVLDFFFFSSTVSGFERKLFGFMAKTVRQPCQKWTFSASGTKRRKFCFKKLYHFPTLFWLQGGSFRTLSGIFQKFCQKQNFCFQRNILD